MSTVYLHAGMATAGSSSVQAWIASEHQKLLEDLGIQPVVHRSSEEDGQGDLKLIRFTHGSIPLPEIY